MFSLKELVHIVLAIILFAFVIWFFQDQSLIFSVFIIASVVILVNVFAKKFAGRYFHTSVEMKTWEFQRWGYYVRSQFKKPKPVGIILPFLVVFASMGVIKMLTFLQTEITPTIRRVIKKRGGVRRYAELTEWHNAWIISIGMLFNAGLVLVPLLIFRNDLLIDIAKYSVYYAAWNMIPLGKLDGTKIISLGFGWWLFIWFWILLASALLFFVVL